MYHTLIAENVNDLNLQAYDLIINQGTRAASNRNSESMGGTTSAYEVNCVLTNPQNRHLNLKGRKSNIFALIGESLWVLAGRDDVEHIKTYIPRAPDFSDDDGLTWRAAYGSRMHIDNQLESMINKFTTDGLYTRRATLSIYHPSLDTEQGMQDSYGFCESKDIPCNQWLNFFVTPDNKLNLKVVQRSGDAIWGALSINVTEFSMLLENVYNILKEKYPELELGSYNQSVTNLHIYDATLSQAQNAIDSETQVFQYSETLPFETPTNTNDSTEFFRELTEYIEERDVHACTDIFEDFQQRATVDNITYLYAVVSKMYYLAKQMGGKGSSKVTLSGYQDVIEWINTSDHPYAVAVLTSSFRNFNV